MSKPIVHIKRIDAREGFNIIERAAHPNPAPPTTARRWDNVSDRKPRNTPSAKNMADVIDRACFRFVKNTRAPK